MLGSDVAANWAAAGRIARVGWGERDHQDLAVDFGHHQPVCWRFGWLEERVGLPHVLNVVDSQSGVFEQVGCLSVDLERVVVVELIEIEQLSHQTGSVIQTNTD